MRMVEIAGVPTGGAAKPRVAILSLREVNRHVSRSNGYDFEDVIAREIDSAELVTPHQAGRPAHLALKAMSWLDAHRLPAPRLGFDGLATAVGEEVDLFFFHPAILQDLRYLTAVKGWRERSRVAVCWFQELWLKELPRLDAFADLLNRFDHVISPFHHTTAALADRLSVPVSYLPWGVSTDLFCPFPAPPRRVIDLCRVGKVDAATDTDLIGQVDRTGGYYYYETATGRVEAESFAAHRRNYAGMLKRSKYFLTYMAKRALSQHRGVQEEFGLRYFEGAAAGTVMLGDVVANPAFAEGFGWTDSVIPSAYGSREVPVLVERLEADPARVAAIRRRNVTEALARHDHLHRWERVLDFVGLQPLPGLDTRRARLADLAAMAARADEALLLS